MAAISGEDGATLTVRFIRSFEYRNFRPVVFHHINLDQNTKDFIDFIREGIPTASGFLLPPITKIREIRTRGGIPPPFKKFSYDTLKIQHKAHQAKTNDPIIRTDNDENLLLKEELTLKENGVENETEISFFKKEDYLKYKANPVLLW